MMLFPTVAQPCPHLTGRIGSEKYHVGWETFLKRSRGCVVAVLVLMRTLMVAGISVPQAGGLILCAFEQPQTGHRIGDNPESLSSPHPPFLPVPTSSFGDRQSRAGA